MPEVGQVALVERWNETEYEWALCSRIGAECRFRCGARGFAHWHTIANRSGHLTDTHGQGPRTGEPRGVRPVVMVEPDRDSIPALRAMTQVGPPVVLDDPEPTEIDRLRDQIAATQVQIEATGAGFRSVAAAAEVATERLREAMHLPRWTMPNVSASRGGIRFTTTPSPGYRWEPSTHASGTSLDLAWSDEAGVIHDRQELDGEILDDY